MEDATGNDKCHKNSEQDWAKMESILELKFAAQTTETVQKQALAFEMKTFDEPDVKKLKKEQLVWHLVDGAMQRGREDERHPRSLMRLLKTSWKSFAQNQALQRGLCRRGKRQH